MKHQGFTIIAALLSCLTLLTWLSGCSKPIGPSEEIVKNDLANILATANETNGLVGFKTLDSVTIKERRVLDETRVEISVASRVRHDVDTMEDVIFELFQKDAMKGRGLTLQEQSQARFVFGARDLDEDNDGVVIFDDLILYRLGPDGVWKIDGW